MRIESPPVFFAEIDAASSFSPDAVRRLTESYRPWRKQRYVAAELGLDARECWRFTKAHRRVLWREIPVSGESGTRLGFCRTPLLMSGLHTVDRASGDDLLQSKGGAFATSPMRKRMDALFRTGEVIPATMRARTSMDEAAESSLIEGASTTRVDALELLRSGRAPVTLAERMVVNNHEAMALVKRRLSEPLSVALLLELQERLTEGTLSDESGIGRLRTAGENVRVIDARTDETIFTPPPAAMLPELLREICAFANGCDPRELHPIVAASCLHFLIGYAHPFIDGNGRTARAVFYWMALRHGYGIFEFLAISEIIRKGASRYPQAYIDCETDDGDLTYFIIFHLEVIGRALERFAEHLSDQELRVRRSEALAAAAKGLNLRQKLVLEHALRKPETQYTVKEHARVNGVVPGTARADLEGLVGAGLMGTTKQGKAVVYVLDGKARRRLERLMT